MQLALLEATKLLGCFRKADAVDPEQAITAVAAALTEYSEAVIRWFCDIRGPWVRENKWPPVPSEVHAMCKEKTSFELSIKKMEALGWKWNGEKWEKPPANILSAG